MTEHKRLKRKFQEIERASEAAFSVMAENVASEGRRHDPPTRASRHRVELAKLSELDALLRERLAELHKSYAPPRSHDAAESRSSSRGKPASSIGHSRHGTASGWTHLPAGPLARPQAERGIALGEPGAMASRATTIGVERDKRAALDVLKRYAITAKPLRHRDELRRAAKAAAMAKAQRIALTRARAKAMELKHRHRRHRGQRRQENGTAVARNGSAYLPTS